MKIIKIETSIMKKNGDDIHLIRIHFSDGNIISNSYGRPNRWSGRFEKSHIAVLKKEKLPYVFCHLKGRKILTQDNYDKNGNIIKSKFVSAPEIEPGITWF